MSRVSMVAGKKFLANIVMDTGQEFSTTMESHR